MTFKKGEPVWIYWFDQATGYPQMYHRPGKITKKIHPLSFKVAFAANDYRQPVEGWTYDRRDHEHHPTELLAYSVVQSWEDNQCNADDHLKALREQWKAEAPKEKQDLWTKMEADRKRMNETINRDFRRVIGRLLD